MRTRALSIVAGIAAISFASLLVASPAAADPATLPEGQKITIVEQIEGSPGGSRMWTVSPENALATDNKLVQSPIDIEAIDVDDDGFGYATEIRFDGETIRTTWLWKADANTGVLSDPVQIMDGDAPLSECRGLDYSGGVITLACTSNSFNGDVQNGFLGTVTPGGAMTIFFDSQTEEDVPLPFTAIAANPTNGQLWVFTDDEGWPVDRSADPWSLGTVVPFENGSDRVDGADFDRDGQLFVVAASEGSRLYTLDPTTADFNFIGEIGSNENAVTPVHAITVWGKKALPATGPAEIVPIGLGTALLLLAGAAFIATGRIQRRAPA